MPPKEAAKNTYVTSAMIYYWVRNGRLKKYQVDGLSRNYHVDLDEVIRVSKTDRFSERPAGNLISRKEAADLIWVGDRMICYYVKMGYITAHYVFGNDKHYLVDRDEVLAQPKLIQERMRHTARLKELSEHAKTLPRDSRGYWTKVKAKD